MNNQNKAIYQAKHAFNGNSSQSQLSFTAGTRIIAAQNQLGQWWWGNCNGKVSLFLCVWDIMSCVFVCWGVRPQCNIWFWFKA